jgi:hypothetical protein
MYMMPTELLRKELPGGKSPLTLLLVREEYTDVYPGMARYLLSVTEGPELRAQFRTNTYEYTPSSTLNAEGIARSRAQTWEDEIRSDPLTFLARHPLPRPRVVPYASTDVVGGAGKPTGRGEQQYPRRLGGGTHRREGEDSPGPLPPRSGHPPLYRLLPVLQYGILRV